MFTSKLSLEGNKNVRIPPTSRDLQNRARANVGVLIRDPEAGKALLIESCNHAPLRLAEQPATRHHKRWDKKGIHKAKSAVIGPPSPARCQVYAKTRSKALAGLQDSISMTDPFYFANY